jgi:hypothetical protein
VSLQLCTAAFVAPSQTSLAPCSAPNPEPVMVNSVWPSTVVGVTVEMDGPRRTAAIDKGLGFGAADAALAATMGSRKWSSLRLSTMFPFRDGFAGNVDRIVQ